MRFICSRGGAAAAAGFTLIEMLATIAIVTILTGMVFLNYATFTSQSLQQTRITELGEYIRLAQELSGSAEIFSTNVSQPTQGFQVVRMKVRGGLLHNFRLEKAGGAFTSFASGSNFALGRDSTVPGSQFIILEPSERYFVDVCFINTDASPRYVRKKLVVNSDQSCASDSMLCTAPDPLAGGYDAVKTARNNFDVHFSVEQPTREVHANVVPITIVGNIETSVYGSTEPNGAAKRISNVYEGVRVVFITTDGNKRSLDIFQTGLISFRPSDSGAGCG